MLGILLKILCVLGWILLCILVLLLICLLTILFFPVTYSACGRLDEKSRTAQVKLRWLFGVLRADYRYPEPGRLLVRLMWRTLYDSGAEKPAKGKTAAPRQSEKEAASEGQQGQVKAEAVPKQTEKAAASEGKQGQAKAEAPKQSEKAAVPDRPQKAQEQGSAEENRKEAKQTETGFDSAWASVRSFVTGLTDIAARLKEIAENIDYYKNLAAEEESRLVFGHIKLRVCKLLSHIRPRRIQGELLFGTGEPDTTGYCMAVYGMISPFLGKNITVTPDFEEAILKGEIRLKGHIMGIFLLRCGLSLMLDQRLHSFIKRLKREDT